MTEKVGLLAIESLGSLLTPSRYLLLRPNNRIFPPRKVRY